VPGHEIGLQSQRRQKTTHCQTGRAQRRLGDPRVGQFSPLPFDRLVVVGRDREHIFAERPRQMVSQQRVGALKGLAHLRELHDQIGQHIRILRSLAGEQEGDLARSA